MNTNYVFNDAKPFKHELVLFLTKLKAVGQSQTAPSAECLLFLFSNITILQVFYVELTHYYFLLNV